MQAGPAGPLESPETGPSIETSVAVGERPELGRPTVLRRPPPIRQTPTHCWIFYCVRKGACTGCGKTMSSSNIASCTRSRFPLISIHGLWGAATLLATIVAFFLAEIGDKTQIATAVLAAEYHPLWQVIAGTTCGMLIADVPAVWLGARFAHALPLRATRRVAAALFAALAVWILLR